MERFFCPRANVAFDHGSSRSKDDLRGGLQILHVYFILTFEIRKFGELKGYGQEFLSCDRTGKIFRLQKCSLQQNFELSR